LLQIFWNIDKITKYFLNSHDLPIKRGFMAIFIAKLRRFWENFGRIECYKYIGKNYAELMINIAGYKIEGQELRGNISVKRK